MSLRNAVLGLLSQRSMNGFELLKEFDVSTSVIWPAPGNEVYRVLAGLKSDGLIEESAIGARGARAYAITPEGRQRLRAWIEAPSDYTLRYEPILKAVFLRDAPVDVRRARVQADLEFFASQLESLKAKDAQWRNAALTEDRRGDARRMAIALYAALSEWARDIIADDPESSTGSGGSCMRD
jgi:DNA-binding PadR family transcriptional regulator